MKKSEFTRLLALLLALLLVLSLVLIPPVAATEETVIVLDPGHGGLDSGAAEKYDGVTVCESHINLKIAQSCKSYLEENYINVRVLLTRETDVKMSLDDRVAFAVEHGADYMLSIHINSSNGYARGALALVPRGHYRPEQAQASIATAEAILEELELLGLTNRGTEYKTNSNRYPDGSYKDYFAIIRGCVQANIPGIIMEHAFLDNEKDYREFLSTDEKLAALGVADALGLASSLGLEEKPKIPSSAELGDTPFEDVFQDDWYYDDVTYVWDQGLMTGISGTEFGAELTANRAMVVTLLYRLDGAQWTGEGSTFSDVEEGSWYHAAVEWAYERGITTGVTETEFAPERSVIREQFVTFLHRYAGSPAPTAMPEDVSDWSDVSEYAAEALAWAMETGLVTGYDDGTVKPLRELNRAELAVLMHRFHLWYLENPPVIEPEPTEPEPTEPEITEPEPTDPDPTEPSEPVETEPGA